MPDEPLTDEYIAELEEGYTGNGLIHRDVQLLLADRKRLLRELERDQCPKCKVDGYWHKACKLQEQWNSDKAATIDQLREHLEDLKQIGIENDLKSIRDLCLDALAELNPTKAQATEVSHDPA